ncbi:MAG: hypothetical protein HY553_08875 [Elusimicrobia bacterium]|nr:hypothetical protein [Elusimicrobiota bacterium]
MGHLGLELAIALRWGTGFMWLGAAVSAGPSPTLAACLVLAGIASFIVGWDLKKRFAGAPATWVTRVVELGLAGAFVAALGMYAIVVRFRIIERARQTEARDSIRALRESQLRYHARRGKYVTDAASLAKLDVVLPAGRSFRLESLGPGAGAGCDGGRSGYRVTFRRAEGVATRWGRYAVVYDSCEDRITYPDCPKCLEDFDYD